MGPASNARKPHPAFDVPGEADLVGRICEILAFRPIEVNNLSSRFATIFNQVVRNNEHTPFCPDKRNDGSFKKWLLACGFEVGPLFERNKSLVYLPQHWHENSRPKVFGEFSPPDRDTPRRRLHRAKNGGTRQGRDYADIAHDAEEQKTFNRRWEVKHVDAEQPQKQLSMLMAAACFLAAPPNVSPDASPAQLQERQSPEMTQTSTEPDPEQCESARSADVADEQDADFSEQEEGRTDLEEDDSAENPAAWVEVQSAFGELEEEDFVVVGDVDSTWEKVGPKLQKQENRDCFEGGAEDGLDRWSIEA